MCNLLRIGRLSELSVNRVFEEQEVMREADANETSGGFGPELGGTLVGLSQFRTPLLDPLVKKDIFIPPISVNLEYHGGWCALKSPRIRVSGVVRRCSIED